MRANGIYSLVGSTVIGDASNITSDRTNKTSLWHLMLAHISEKGLQELARQNLLCGDKIKDLEFYEQCVLGKAKRVKFAAGTHNTQKPLDYVHCDLWGPSNTQAHGGGTYFLSIIDDYSRRVWVHVLETKDDIWNVQRMVNGYRKQSR